MRNWPSQYNVRVCVCVCVQMNLFFKLAPESTHSASETKSIGFCNVMPMRLVFGMQSDAIWMGIFGVGATPNGNKKRERGISTTCDELKYLFGLEISFLLWCCLPIDGFCVVYTTVSTMCLCTGNFSIWSVYASSSSTFSFPIVFVVYAMVKSMRVCLSVSTHA